MFRVLFGVPRVAFALLKKVLQISNIFFSQVIRDNPCFNNVRLCF